MKIIRSMYDWVLHWAATPYALPALFFVAFVESSFLPIPPDVLLIAMTVAVPALWVKFSFVCSLASVIGGMFGYFIGYQFMDKVGNRIVEFYHLHAEFEKIGALYNEHQALAVAAAGFTPLPYKIFALAAGSFKINFPVFVLMSAVSRCARFFLIGFIIHKFGPPIKVLIEKYFNLCSVVFFILLIIGFYLLKFVL